MDLVVVEFSICFMLIYTPIQQGGIIQHIVTNKAALLSRRHCHQHGCVMSSSRNCRRTLGDVCFSASANRIGFTTGISEARFLAITWVSGWNITTTDVIINVECTSVCITRVCACMSACEWDWENERASECVCVSSVGSVIIYKI